MQRIVREGAGEGRGKAKGLRLHDVERMAGYCDGLCSLYGVRDAALFCVMFDAALRVSEAHGLNVTDLRETDKGEGLNLIIRRSKTDQAGVGAVAYIGPNAAQRLKRWIQAAKITDGPLFRAIHNGKVSEKRFSTHGMAHTIKKRAKEVGIDGTVRSHSFRRGVAMEHSLAGEPIQEVAKVGRWKNPAMVVEYIKDQQAEQNAVARLHARGPDLRSVKIG